STIGLEKFQLFDALDKLVDVIVDSDEDPGFKVSTILDMSSAPPAILRQGLGWDHLQEWIAFE
ncbi:MAG: threonylcarbamoyl-AMP synthase, partial [Microcystaceae cyanobacterium]